MRTGYFKTFSDAYRSLLYDVFYNYEYETKPRDMKIKEITNATFTVLDTRQNLYENEIRSSPIKYICDELIWYLSNDVRVNWIGKRASLWNSITNPGTKEVNSNYGYLIFYATNPPQYHWAYSMLANDKDSRQALMNYNGVSNSQFFGCKDVVCTLTQIFQIRDNKLNTTVTMRSNDIIYGLPIDFVWFSIIHQQMYKHLLNIYPDLKLGSYTHISHSLHLYEKHFNLVEKMLEKPFITKSMPEFKEDIVDEYGELLGDTVTLIQKSMYNYDVGPEPKSEFLKFIYDNHTKDM